MVQLCSVTMKWCHQLSWEFYSQLRVIVCDMFSCSLRCRMVGEGPLHGHAAATATATLHERAGNGAPPAVPNRGKEFEFGGSSSSIISFPGYCRHSVHGSIPELYGSGWGGLMTFACRPSRWKTCAAVQHVLECHMCFHMAIAMYEPCVTQGHLQLVRCTGLPLIVAKESRYQPVGTDWLLNIERAVKRHLPQVQFNSCVGVKEHALRNAIAVLQLQYFRTKAGK